MTNIPPTIPLTAHILRFTARVITPMAFNEFKGSALRGAFASVLRRTFCPEWRADKTDPFHRALCPICQLLAAEQQDGAQGDIRRAYAIQPPLDQQTQYAPGDTFTFTMTLFGDALKYLPYLVLAVGGMGEEGVGKKVAGGGGQVADSRWQMAGGEESGHGAGEARRGRFEVERIDAVNPFTGEMQPMMEAGQRMVSSETLPITTEQILAAADELANNLAAHDNLLHIEFRTPTRILRSQQRQTQPEFFPLGKQTVLRTVDLSAQHGAGRPTIAGDPLQLNRDIYPHLERVELVKDETRWWDLHGYSGRLKRAQVLGGLVGTATYQTVNWRPLLPWLLWGTVTGVGKNVVKGCGVFGLVAGGQWPSATGHLPPAIRHQPSTKKEIPCQKSNT